MMEKDIEIIVIGGSSGCIPVIMQIIHELPVDFKIPVVIVIHRLKNVDSQLKTMLSPARNIIEPEDKEPVKAGGIYLAPQNYHLLLEEDKTFSLDYSEPVHFSRPSIDVTFVSASIIYKTKTIGILLSGANNDGAEGIHKIIMNGGMGIVQDPLTAENTAMPVAAININKDVQVLTPEQIVKTIFSILS
jgi:two-component system chemotaxis response regulator CheB